MPDRSRPGATTTALPAAMSQGTGSEKYATGTYRKTIKLPTDKTVIGTWNIRTLFACGKIKELTHELSRYQWDILGLSEVRWTGSGETTTEEGHKIWYSGDEKKHQHGVGFIVNKEKINCIISCRPVNNRIISLRVGAQPLNLTIIQVYAPTSDYEDEDIELFYNELEECIKGVPKKDILIVMGDWNARIGEDAFEQWAGISGRFGIGETNDRGIRLLEFASTYKLTLANTLFPHKASRKTTWHSPNNKTHSQIDYILFPSRFKSSINKAKTRTFPGADIGSDHDMVLMTIKLKLKKNRRPKNPRIRYDLEKLRDPDIAEMFKANVGGKFAALTLIHDNINSLTDTIKTVLHETATEILGNKRKKIKPWVTDDILNLCDKRREFKKKKGTNPQSTEDYRSINKEIRTKMKSAKEEWITEQCNNIDISLKDGNSKKAFETLKKLTNTKQARPMGIENSKGCLLTEEADILGRWTEYCMDLYNHKISPDYNLINNNLWDNREIGDSPILETEVEEAIRSLKGGKSPGIDNIPSELIKHGGPQITKWMRIICQKIWDGKEWPTEWTQSLIIPLPKKGNIKQCQNYRTISLISHPSKIMLRIILNRLKRKAEEILSEEQAGFRAGRSTVEQIFNIRILNEKCLQHQKMLIHNFIDFKKAFDRVWHDGLWQVMKEFNIDKNIIDVIKALYNKAHSAVLLNNQIGEKFRTTIGVRQGCILSPVLFNIFLEYIMIQTLQGFTPSLTINGRPISNLRFADDIDLIGENVDQVQDLTSRLDVAAKSVGMEISTEKSKILISGGDNSGCSIKLDGHILEEVDTFKYLGSTLTREGGSIKEIKIRLGLASSIMAKLWKIWKSNISFPVKIKLYSSLALSVFLYGCESWTLNAEAERRIQAFENKCYRKLLGIRYQERKTNEYVLLQVHKLAGKQESLLSTVRRRKMKWFGHIVRHDSLTKTILQGTVEGARRKGRQRKNWLDNLKEWTGLPLDTLLQTAADRDEWRNLVSRTVAAPPRRKSRV